MPFYGSKLNLPVRSLTSILVTEPTLGIDVSQPSVDAPLGSTPSSENFIMREGALECRPALQLRNANPQPLSVGITGGWEFQDVSNARYPVVSGTTTLAWYSNGSWSQLSYVSAFGTNSPPNGSQTSYWDATWIYYANNDQNIAILANGSYQSLYCWQSGTTVFSTLTGAPPAKTVTAFDNYILAFNIRDPGSSTSEYVQRVQWNDRGSASSWTGGLSGFEDLLTMRGEGTRIVAQENRVILFSDREIWQGFHGNFPSVFVFELYDPSVGCPYPWTISDTPLGLIFLSRDLQTYLLPKGGGTAFPIGGRFHRRIRESIDVPQRAWSVFDQATRQWQLYYPIVGGTGYPQRAAYLNTDLFSRGFHLNPEEGSFALQTFDPVAGGISLTRGFTVTGLATSSLATSWDQVTQPWDTVSLTWDQFGGATTSADRRDVYVGTSGGTVAVFDSVATQDLGVAIPNRWRSTSLWGEIPTKQKTVTEWRCDYQADSNSNLTLKFSQNQGASFEQGVGVNLPAISGASQAIAYPYLSSPYPMFELSSEGFRFRLFRFFTSARIGGR